MVRVLDCRSSGCGFESRRRRFTLTPLATLREESGFLIILSLERYTRDVPHGAEIGRRTDGLLLSNIRRILFVFSMDQ